MAREKNLVCIKRTLASSWECIAVCSDFKTASCLCNGVIDTYADAGIVSSHDAVRLGVVPASPAPYGWDSLEREIGVHHA